MTRQKESRRTAGLLQWLDRTFGEEWWGYKTHGTMYTRRGLPDVVGCFGGIPIMVEMKEATGRAEALQLHQLHRASRAGAHSFVVYGVEGVKEFKEHMRWLSKEHQQSAPKAAELWETARARFDDSSSSVSSYVTVFPRSRARRVSWKPLSSRSSTRGTSTA